jgi:SAM-dependent methyltransferase
MEHRLGRTLGLQRGAPVLDAGCGAGRVAAELASAFGYYVCGVDLVPEHIADAQGHASARGVTHLTEFHLGNYGALPYPDASFDGLYTIETLCHAASLEAVLAEFRRVMRAGAKLVLFEYSHPPRDEIRPQDQRIFDLVVEITGMASLERFVHGSFPGLLQAAGFTDIKVTDIREHVWPTMGYLHNIAIVPFLIARRLGRLHEHPNIVGAVYGWRHREHIAYNVIEAIR